MPDASTQVNVRILDRDYQVACPPEERQSLIDAADLLSRRMEEVRDSGRVIGMERIAVMVALNLAHQYLEAEGERGAVSGDTLKRLRELRLQLAAVGAEQADD
ncbi:MAG TPA: cell division protein ZapA [Gammaproteobacteria bacterium]|nr:cell division protein ZapA [Gammaproteobacteria bacterium]